MRRMRLICQHGKQSVRVLIEPGLGTLLLFGLLGVRNTLEKSPTKTRGLPMLGHEHRAMLGNALRRGFDKLNQLLIRSSCLQLD